MPREGGYGGADYGEGGAYEDDPTQDELSGSDASAMTKYLMPGIWFTARPTTLSGQRRMRVDAFVGVAAGDQFAVFVKVFLHAVNDDSSLRQKTATSPTANASGSMGSGVHEAAHGNDGPWIPIRWYRIAIP